MPIYEVKRCRFYLRGFKLAAHEVRRCVLLGMPHVFASFRFLNITMRRLLILSLWKVPSSQTVLIYFITYLLLKASDFVTC